MDRIAVRMAEITLEPVKMLRSHSMLTAVTLRASARPCRVQITIAKTWPKGKKQPPGYRWDVREIDADGEVEPSGRAWRGPDEGAEPYADPEEAYWAAASALAEWAARERTASGAGTAPRRDASPAAARPADVSAG